VTVAAEGAADAGIDTVAAGDTGSEPLAEAGTEMTATADAAATAVIDDVSGQQGHDKKDKFVADASTLGSLNAAHASPTARLHSNADSRVGKIAQFEQAAANGDALVEEMKQLDRQITELQAQRQVLYSAGPAELQQEISAREAELEILDPESPNYAQEMEALNEDLQALRGEVTSVSELGAEIDNELSQLVTQREQAQMAFEASAEAEAAALDEAANKEVNAGVVATIKSWFGGDSN
jgi:chromosome segregation ATPase